MRKSRGGGRPAGPPHVSAGLGTMLLGVSGSWEDSEVTSLPEEVPKEPDSEKETWGRGMGKGAAAVRAPSPSPSPLPQRRGLPATRRGRGPGPVRPGPSRSGPARCGAAHQLLEGGGLLQVALQGELAERFPGRLVGLDLHGAALHGTLVADGAAGHQRRPGEALQALRAHGPSFKRGCRPSPTTPPAPAAAAATTTTSSSLPGGAGGRALTVLSLCCCCWSCFMRMDFFLSLQRLFWNQTRMTRGLSPVISTSCSFIRASGRGLAA